MQQQGAASLAEDLAPPVAAPDPLAEPPWVETPESIAQVLTYMGYMVIGVEDPKQCCGTVTIFYGSGSGSDF
jgi:hypothetical protein